MTVPTGQPQSRTSPASPPSIASSAPTSASAVRLWQRNRETSAIAARASPRKPSVLTRNRSSAPASLLVACGRKARGRSSGPIPEPSSATRIRSRPPRSTVSSTREAPASIAFSSSSLTTLAGRSTTSPAAIWLMTDGGSSRIRPIAPPPFAVASHVHSTF